MLKIGIDVAMVTTKADNLKCSRVLESTKQADNPGYRPHCETCDTTLQESTLKSKNQDKTTELLDLGIIEPVET